MNTANRSKLVSMTIKNIGCIGDAAVTIALDKVVCLVGKNNVGKTTILRAYELARGDIKFDRSKDRYLRAKSNEPSEIILDIHVPDNIGNISNEWKIVDGDLKIVRNRWQWCEPDFNVIRTTWHPKAGENGSGDWSEDKKAGGLDNVFKSRLPRAIRIGSLEDAEETEKTLLALALQPLIDKLNLEKQDAESKLTKAIKAITEHINSTSTHHRQTFNEISQKVTDGFKSVFPELSVSLNIMSGPMSIEPDKIIKSGSGLIVRDGELETSLVQQGTGARRALFWAMLQVHNQLERESEIRRNYRKGLEDDKNSLQKEVNKKSVKADRKLEITSQIESIEALIKHFDDGGSIPQDKADPALPGYLLLIDEPENALHPLAAKAAQRHLYNLADNPDWQVIMTTHSPYFINPFEDHTTIVRLDRSYQDKKEILVKTYRSDNIDFDGDEKQKLQALQLIDPSFSEIFFGSYPILVEGDTEHAAFLAAIVKEKNDLLDKITIIRARGKSILLPIIKVMNHFKINFSIVHDCDSPFKRNGHNNGMWTENKKIRDAIQQARKDGLLVRHRISIPDFERFLGGEEESKDKPFNAFIRIQTDNNTKIIVQKLLDDLLTGEEHDCISSEKLANQEYLDALLADITQWANNNNLADDIRFFGKP
ncbi:AAA family ATPase [Cronobacter dublinensis]|uniref:AAA family ATPase n=1 Tax=Cronobacter dublinensis TaxID=413497 RepID=UPI0024C3E19B|nr:AAA family ATPase [Cronobacter dublinensis]ELY6214348.1 AAA family ATPase [Cronobacter dublinensis]EMD9249436.1 AAA family ATPase [Cronobacter dublinensis]MDK1199571.1 AAA family ATPase [Cronobacter dublinensis]